MPAASIYGSRRALASRNTVTNIYTPRPSMKHVTLDATPDSLPKKPASSNHRKRIFEELGSDPEVSRTARCCGARRDDDGLAVNSWLGEEGEGVKFEEEPEEPLFLPSDLGREETYEYIPRPPDREPRTPIRHEVVSSPPSSNPPSAAATLRLRLRVALFKVQTNQTSIPISHLQVPQSSPQPLSIFPPSLVRISPNIPGLDGDDIGVSPPSSPPPIDDPFSHGNIRSLTPSKSSSPTPAARGRARPSQIS